MTDERGDGREETIVLSPKSRGPEVQSVSTCSGTQGASNQQQPSGRSESKAPVRREGVGVGGGNIEMRQSWALVSLGAGFLEREGSPLPDSIPHSFPPSTPPHPSAARPALPHWVRSTSPQGLEAPEGCGPGSCKSAGWDMTMADPRGRETARQKERG